MGTAFALLLLLIAMIMIVRLISEQVIDRLSDKMAERTVKASADKRLMALAAVAAVTSLRGGSRVPGPSDNAGG
ncbi:MAG: hypothetical protein O3A47_10050 [Chloroflexi bacterium]|nr:hypothetical protein [Chloroflexota bacterium]